MISAKILEKPYAQLRYKLVTNPEPGIIALSEDGSLSVMIQEGGEYRIEVETEYEGNTFRKEYVIQTILQSESKKICVKDLGKAFSEESQYDQKSKLDVFDIVKNLPSGVVGKKYHAYILNNSDTHPGLKIKVENLPIGLIYNGNNYEITGIPKKKGLTSVQFKNEFGNNLGEIQIEIKNSSIFDSPIADESVSNEDTKQVQKNAFKPGKAFDF